jgi:hypothetical protein
MDIKQLLGILGSLFLYIGVFSPIVYIPIVGDQNYFQNGKGDGVILLVISTVSLILTLTRVYKGLWLTGLGSFAVLIFTFVKFQLKMSELTTQMDKDLAGNPFRGLADIAVHSIQLQWGWGILLSGVVLLISAALIKANKNVKNNISAEKNIECKINDIENETFDEDEQIYEEISKEIEFGNKIKSVWVRSVAESNGDDKKAESIYIRLRVEKIRQNNNEKLFEKNKKIKSDNLEIIKHKYKNGEGINDFDDDGDTPLMKAVLNKEYELVKFLLESGANPKIEYMGSSLKSIANKNNCTDIYDVLTKYENKF